jgi:hypothetical protein
MRVNPVERDQRVGVVVLNKSRHSGHFLDSLSEKMQASDRTCPLVTQVQLKGNREDIMTNLNRRSALQIGFAAVSAAMVKPAIAQTTDALAGKDTSPWPGVVMRSYGEAPSLIPGYKTVSMRDIIMQPGSKTEAPPMMNPMVCHILEGELRIEQEGKTFTGKKNYAWTCNTGTKEQAFNDGSVLAVMRITDLKT